MLCAHTVRRLKPGTLEQFEEAFRPTEDVPPGWVRFHLLRGLADQNEIVTGGHDLGAQGIKDRRVRAPGAFRESREGARTDCGSEFRFEGKNGGTQMAGRLWIQQHGVLRVLEPLMRLRLKRALRELPDNLRRGIEAKR